MTAEPRVTLLSALRDQLGLTGAKLVCDRGACGACTVHLDGRPVTSCMVLASRARGHEITTIEGLGTADRMHRVQSAFVANDALQCGFCTPGMVMSIAAELERNPPPASTTSNIRWPATSAAAAPIRMSSRRRSRRPDSRARRVRPPIREAGLLMARRATLKLGFAGDVRDVTVVIPDDEPIPWQWGEQFSVLRKETPRVDGPLKATGGARYSYDIQLPAMLYGAILASPYAHAMVRSVDLSEAQRQSGVMAALRVEDDEVRFAGQESPPSPRSVPRLRPRRCATSRSTTRRFRSWSTWTSDGRRGAKGFRPPLQRRRAARLGRGRRRARL